MAGEYPTTLADAMQQWAHIGQMQNQSRLMDVRARQAEQESQQEQQMRQLYQGGNRPTAEQLYSIDPRMGMEYEASQAKAQGQQVDVDLKKHQAISNLAADALRKLEAAGIQDPAQAEDFVKRYQANMKPYIQNVLGLPGNADMSLEQIKMLANSTSEQGAQDWITYNDAQQGGFMMNKKTGDVKPLEYNGKQLRAPQYDVPLTGQLTREKQINEIVKGTNEQGQEYYDTKGNLSGINNPGNIRPTGQSSGFQQYGSPEEGLKAIDDNLAAYGSKHGINTLAGVINRWSPSSENDTARLIETASKRLGIKPDQEIDLSDPVQRHAISSAIALQENNIFGRKGPVKSQSTEEKERIKRESSVIEAGDEKRAETQVQAENDLPQAEQQASEAIQLLDQLKKHPGLAGVVGMPSISGITHLPGTDEASFRERLGQIQGKAFLEAFKSLKGGGQITEIEGEKATKAIARLGTAQTEKEFIGAIEELQSVAAKGLDNLRRKAKQSPSQPQQTRGVTFMGFE